MKVKAIVTLKEGVLDPQGKAIQQTLNGMNFSDVQQVRQGKYFDIEVNIEDEKKAKAKVEEMCKKLLTNLVIEDYRIL
jgi:phosphoribosylformylglycinamidine synthase|tara:strand:+ start:426 stop:659 length:234 start_codon:yes stop_codon:yes gene_type:complete